MPYEIKFDHVPAGISMNAARPNEMIQIRVFEFISTEDGDTLIERLDALASQVLLLLPENVRYMPGQVDHLLAIVRRDGTATVYINELQMAGSVQMKKDVK